MKIDSMDAAFKSTVSVAPTQVKQETAVESERHVSDNTRNTEENISDAFLQSSIDRVNHTFELQRRSVRFKIHDRTNEVMVKIIDAETEEVIREIPPEKLLDMFANMLELAGLIVDERR